MKESLFDCCVILVEILVVSLLASNQLGLSPIYIELERLLVVVAEAGLLVFGLDMIVALVVPDIDEQVLLYYEELVVLQDAVVAVEDELVVGEDELLVLVVDKPLFLVVDLPLVGICTQEVVERLDLIYVCLLEGELNERCVV